MGKCLSWISILGLLEIKFCRMGHIKPELANLSEELVLDEFPQFFNVLKGDMSIGRDQDRPLISGRTRICMNRVIKRGLAIKPGITGMWQVSGRSDITDFEEVVRLDKEYIELTGILGWILRSLLKTVMVVAKKDGSM